MQDLGFAKTTERQKQLASSNTLASGRVAQRRFGSLNEYLEICPLTPSPWRRPLKVSLTVDLCVRNHNPSVCVVAAVFQRRGGSKSRRGASSTADRGQGPCGAHEHNNNDARFRVAHLEFVRDGGPMHLIEQLPPRLHPR